MIDRLNRRTTRCISPSTLTDEEIKSKFLDAASRPRIAFLKDNFDISYGDNVNQIASLLIQKLPSSAVSIQNAYLTWVSEPLNAIRVQFAASLFFDPSEKRMQEEFGATSSIENFEKFTSEFVERMKAEQSILRKYARKPTIRLYRGLDLEKGHGVTIGPTRSFDYPVSSWTLTPVKALGFGEVIVQRDVLIEHIISSFLTNEEIRLGREDEFLVYTPSDGVEIEVVRVE